MEQIIVNVAKLTIEEKKNVNEVLAKIRGCRKMTSDNLDRANWMYAPGAYIGNQNTWSDGDTPIEDKKPTHTSTEILEMAGVEEMTENRKVRKDFDPTKEYNVDVSNCTEDEKKLVQQAFFDVGISWDFSGKTYKHLDVKQYTNTMDSGEVTTNLMFSKTAEDYNMTAKEFLALVYEPEHQGHPHAHLMAQYAEDAKTTDKPWELWQIKITGYEWRDLTCNPSFATHLGYRRKPKTKLVHGVEVPDISFIPEQDENYYYPDIDLPELYDDDYYDHSFPRDEMRIKGNRCYPYTEEGKQAAILHAKAMLCLV